MREILFIGVAGALGISATLLGLGLGRLTLGDVKVVRYAPKP